MEPPSYIRGLQRTQWTFTRQFGKAQSPTLISEVHSCFLHQSSNDIHQKPRNKVMVKYWMAVVGAMIRNPGNTAIVLVIWISLVFVEKYFFSTWFLGVILMILCALTPMSIDYVDSKLKKETEE